MPAQEAIDGLRVELTGEADRIRAVESDWRDLATARGNAFVTPEWFWAIRRHYGEAEDTIAAIVRTSDDALAGLIPLALDGRGLVRFAGSGLGDHFEPLAGAGGADAVAGAVGRALAAEGRGRALLLENVAADGSWWARLAAANGYRGHPLVDRRSELPSVALDGLSWDEYLATKSRNLRSQVGRKFRALERDHDAAVRWTGAGDDVATEMATLFRLHDMRWESRPGTSSLTGARARAFHADFAAALAERGWLRLCFLEADGRPVAGWYGWRIGERFAYYQAGFDPAWADKSVGFVLLSQTIRAAADEGAARYDMLLGDEAFKGRFADESREVCTALAAPRFSKVRLAAGAEAALRRSGRRLPERVREPAKRMARSTLDRLPLARRR
jgi:CelD/BcsL family acetyltransferase involved in cellulose biosynthesis